MLNLVTIHLKLKFGGNIEKNQQTFADEINRNLMMFWVF